MESVIEKKRVRALENIQKMYARMVELDNEISDLLQDKEKEFAEVVKAEKEVKEYERELKRMRY